ncbi:FAD-dependent oxidoreductase [Methylophilus sp. 13]|uniref:hydroxysqualene dehydroxylase HpnE n=1 Tax=Methylophilus sp. 13 TaxID=2781018 RepID=UPI00188E0987|nr:hydroxysqualene dehydroxylase HpnE [Methylophilus sp. 13]MBF5039002.1 FAD-dependent oxidoreductase [Methylophilus sp. 13]
MSAVLFRASQKTSPTVSATAKLRRVAVIGAGLAGLSTALRLGQQGYQVCVFEAAPQAGGRARGVSHSSTTLDNGQHLCLGAYHATLALLRDAGLDHRHVFKRLALALHMHDGQHRISLVTPEWLPAPLHLLWGLITATGLDWKSKWRAICWMRQLQKTAFTLAQDMPVSGLLAQAQQTPLAIKYLWEPLCLAALNTPLALASAQVFLNVLRDSFQHRRQDSDFLVARSDLSTALIQPLLTQLQTQGVAVRLGTTVTALEAFEHGCKLTHQQQEVFDAVVLAVGPHQLKTIAGAPTLPWREYQPITTIYLQFSDQVRLPHPIMGLCGGWAQWVFDRGQCCDQAGLLAVVISAHAPFEMDKAVLVTHCLNEINAALGNYDMALQQTPLWTKIITEKRATFSCSPALKRPGPQTAHARIFLAGDYVASPYPATIESAIRSGEAAAQAIARLLG